MSKSISQKLIEAAQRLVDFEAGHDPFYWDENDIKEHEVLEQACAQLAQEVEWDMEKLEAIVNGPLGSQLFELKQRESLWRRLDKTYDRMVHCPDYTQTTGDRIDQNIDDFHTVQELRKQLNLEDS